jgi:ubiquinone biosynthesis protein UbiJ
VLPIIATTGKNLHALQPYVQDMLKQVIINGLIVLSKLLLSLLSLLLANYIKHATFATKIQVLHSAGTQIVFPISATTDTNLHVLLSFVPDILQVKMHGPIVKELKNLVPTNLVPIP